MKDRYFILIWLVIFVVLYIVAIYSVEHYGRNDDGAGNSKILNPSWQLQHSYL